MLVGVPDSPNSEAYFYVRSSLLNTRTKCFLQLGQPTEAVATARQAVREANGSFPREVAFSQLRVGQAHAAAREPETAAHALAEAADLAVSRPSKRLYDELRRTRASLQPWQETSAVRELDERLQAYQLG